MVHSQRSFFHSFKKKRWSLYVCILVLFEIIITFHNTQYHFSWDSLWLDPFIFPVNYKGTTNKLPKKNLISITPIHRNITYDISFFGYIDKNERQRNKYIRKDNKRLYSFPKNYTIARSLFIGCDTSVVFTKSGKTKGLRFSPRHEARRYIQGPVKYSIDEAIAVGSGQMYTNWGHTIQDFFHPFLLLPEDVRNRSIILASFVESGIEILKLMGYKESQILKMKPGEWAYVSIAHFFVPHSLLDCYADLAMQLKNMFFDKFNLWSISPTRYCFSNRQFNTSRYIANMNDIIESAKTHFPDIPWEIFADDYQDLTKMAKQFASVLFIYMPTGSNAIKTCFMHNYTVMVTVCAERLDLSILLNAASTSVFLLQYPAKFPHFSLDPINASVPKAIKNIERGLYCVKHKRWPPYPQ